MTQEEKLKFHYLTNEIFEGFSIVSSKQYQELYIKHLNNKISYLVNKEVIELAEKGKKKGMISEKEKIKEIISLGLWSQDKSDALEKDHMYLNGLKLSKAKVFLKAQIDFYVKEIETVEKTINEKTKEKKMAFGPTLETYIERKTNELYIFYSIFKDKEFSNLLFQKEEFEDLEENELNEIYEIYMGFSENFSRSNIQKMALLPSFLNPFFVCDNNPLIFFGIPVKDLTYNQLEIFNYGATFKRILSELKGGFDEKYYDSPQDLIEMFEGREMVKESLEKRGDRDNISLVGATKEDYERLGLLEGAKIANLSKTLGNKKSMTFEEIIARENKP